MPHRHTMKTVKTLLQGGVAYGGVALLMGLTNAVSAGAVASDAGAGSDVCQIAVERYRDLVLTKIANPTDPTRSRPAHELYDALATWLVAKRSGEAGLRDFAVARFDAFLDREGGNEDRDFHIARPFGLLALELHEAGLLTGPRRERAAARAVPLVSWYLGRYPLDQRFYDCNIALAQMVAASSLARVFADDPAMPVAAVREKVAALGEAILATGDLDENASLYSSLGICFFLELATLEGWLDRIAASEDFRRMFCRMRDIVSPAGSIPEYGDSYFQASASRLDFVLLLEMATRLYDDGSFRAVGRHLLPQAGAPIVPDDLCRGFMLLKLEPFTPSAASPLPLSAVQERRVGGDPPMAMPDKLILKTGLDPKATMVMLDLHAGGSHVHPYKCGAVGYYEVAGVPLFHNLGRRGTSSAPCGNLFWALEDAAAFPGHPRAGVWNTMNVPVAHLRRGTAPDNWNVSDAVDFRTFPMPGTQTLLFDNLRLTGPAGTLLLDGFESAESWADNAKNVPAVGLATSELRKQGTASQEVNPQAFRHQVATRMFEQADTRRREVSAADFDRVQFDFLFTGRAPHINLRRLFDQWVDLGDHVLPCRVVAARATQSGRDAWGEIEFADYLRPGNRLVRRVAVTADGGLVIADTFSPAASSRGWSAGQLWQLYELDARGKDWFVAKSDGSSKLRDGTRAERRMLVKHLGGPGVAIDSVEMEPTTMHAPRADGTRRNKFVTTFSRRDVVDRPLTAVLAVVPLEMGEDAEAVAGQIRLAAPVAAAETLVARATLPAAGGECTVEITTTGTTITRP
jgi:hypothetical protein